MNQLELIVRILKVINESKDLGELLNSLSKATVQLTGADSCLIYLYDRDDENLVLMGSSSALPSVSIKLRIGEGIAGLVGKDRKPIAICEKAYEDPRFKVFRILEQDTYEAILSMPILFRGNLVGVINLQHREPHKHTKREFIILEMIASLVSGVLERDWLYEQYKKKALLLEELLKSALKDDEDIVLRLEKTIFDFTHLPVKVLPYREKHAPFRSRYFSVIINERKLNEEQAKAIKLLLHQADLVEDRKKLREEIEERKLVERAKGILMNKGMSESEAYEFIRRKAMDSRRKMKDIAETILLLENLNG